MNEKPGERKMLRMIETMTKTGDENTALDEITVMTTMTTTPRADETVSVNASGTEIETAGPTDTAVDATGMRAVAQMKRASMSLARAGTIGVIGTGTDECAWKEI